MVVHLDARKSKGFLAAVLSDGQGLVLEPPDMRCLQRWLRWSMPAPRLKVKKAIGESLVIPFSGS